MELLGAIAEFFGNISLGIAAWKKRGVFPVVSIFVAGLVFAFFGGVVTLLALALLPSGYPLAVAIAVSFSVVTIAFASQRAGVKLGFLLTPRRGITFAVFVFLGSIGVLYLANAL